jgi:hypothetical protein
MFIFVEEITYSFLLTYHIMSILKSAYAEKKQGKSKSKSVAPIYKLLGCVIFFSTLLIYLKSIHRVIFDVPDSPSPLGWKRIGLHFHSANSHSNSSHNHNEGQSLAYSLLKKQTRIIIQYTACGGLVNQLYSTIAAMALATTMGAEIVLPPAVHRDSFAKHFSTKAEANDVTWYASPLDDILDVDRFRNHWKSRGLILHPTPTLSPFADCIVPETAYPLYKPTGIDQKFIVQLEGIYVKALHIRDLERSAIERILLHTLELMAADPDNEIPAIVFATVGERARVAPKRGVLV